jgi:hypothetical protein
MFLDFCKDGLFTKIKELYEKDERADKEKQALL